MATEQIKDVSINDFSSGVYDDTSVGDSVMPTNALRRGVNVVFGRPRGAISQRYGTTVLGDQAGASDADITGVYNFRSSNSSYNKLLCSSNTVIRYLNGATWTNTVTGLTTGLKTRFVTFLDHVAILNGTDAVQSWSGTGAWTTTAGPLDVANFPKTKVAVLMNGRVLAIGNSTYPAQIYESSIASGGAVSWTSGNRQTQVYTNDGNGDLISAVSNGRVTMLFKQRAQYRYDGNSLQFIAPIGTTSHESVVTDDEGVSYFFGQGASSVGFYATSGGFPKKISRPVQKWVEAIDPTFYDDIAGYTDGTSVCWSIGSVSIDGITYTNAGVVYNTADRTWSCTNHADRFLVYSQYIDSTGAVTVLGGDADGYIQTIGSGNTDNGTAISSEIETGPLFFGSRGRSKYLDQVLTHVTDIQGMEISMKVDGIIRPIGGVTAKNTLFDSLDLRGRKFNMLISCTNSLTPFIFEGFTFPGVQDEGLVF
uniref:Uncharacterized protein n=1 Tax=viral metagenome TaxID=1070528 RepID=A0A6H1ZGF1_9ZZZZ